MNDTTTNKATETKTPCTHCDAPSAHGLCDACRAQMKQAFDRVTKDMENWKHRISVRVVLSRSERKWAEVAIPFFTGSVASFAVLNNGYGNPRGALYRVEAAGYYATIGA